VITAANNVVSPTRFHHDDCMAAQVSPNVVSKARAVKKMRNFQNQRTAGGQLPQNMPIPKTSRF